MATENDFNEKRKQLASFYAEIEVDIEELGDELAKSEGYDSINGFDAIYLYLIKKYNWTPSYVRQMPIKDLRLVLNTERSKSKRKKIKPDSQGWEL